MTDLQVAILERYGSDEARRVQVGLRERVESFAEKGKLTDQEQVELEQAQEKLKSLCRSLLHEKSVTFGRFIADERRTPNTTPYRRKSARGPGEWWQAVRNRAGGFKFHADRAMIRDEFTKLWQAQKDFGAPVSEILTDELPLVLDDESGDSDWRHRGQMFGQRHWDSGIVGRCGLRNLVDQRRHHKQYGECANADEIRHCNNSDS